MSWTPDRIDRLIDMAADRMSASEIAFELGVTRNAVIGKCSRIGVQLKGEPGGWNSKPRAPQVGRPRSDEARQRHLEAERQRRIARKGERDGALRTAYHSGASDGEIAAKINTNRKQVYRDRKRLGLPPNFIRGKNKPKAPPAPPPNSGQALFLDVIETRRRCRWIDGDPCAVPIEQLRCCGAPVSEGSYCEYHAAVINGIAATFPSPAPDVFGRPLLTVESDRSGGRTSAPEQARSLQEAWAGRP